MKGTLELARFFVGVKFDHVICLVLVLFVVFLGHGVGHRITLDPPRALPLMIIMQNSLFFIFIIAYTTTILSMNDLLLLLLLLADLEKGQKQAFRAGSRSGEVWMKYL